MTEKEKNNWIKEHSDTISIIFAIFLSAMSSVMWINSKFNEIEKDIAIIKTVLVMKNIMPEKLAQCEKKTDE